MGRVSPTCRVRLGLLQQSAEGSLLRQVLERGGIQSLPWDGQVKEPCWKVKAGLVALPGAVADDQRSLGLAGSLFGNNVIRSGCFTRKAGDDGTSWKP